MIRIYSRDIDMDIDSDTAVSIKLVSFKRALGLL